MELPISSWPIVEQMDLLFVWIMGSGFILSISGFVDELETNYAG